MGQTVWYKEDIANILRGVELACRQTAALQTSRDSSAFQEGYMAALAAAATSFGIRVQADIEVRHKSRHDRLLEDGMRWNGR